MNLIKQNFKIYSTLLLLSIATLIHGQCTVLSLILRYLNLVVPLLILIGWKGAAFFPYTRETDEYTTSDAKNDRRANSLQLSPDSNVKKIAVPQRSPGIEYAGMSFEAASQFPISIPILTLAGRCLSVIFPTDDIKVRAGQDDGGMRVLSKCGS